MRRKFGMPLSVCFAKGPILTKNQKNIKRLSSPSGQSMTSSRQLSTERLQLEISNVSHDSWDSQPVQQDTLIRNFAWLD
jgi:hypothetical protein